MYHKVYRSLDKECSRFGLVGSYFTYFVYGCTGSVVLGLVVGGTVNGLVGVLAFLAGGAASYVGVLAFQSRYTESERTKMFCRKMMPQFITVRPVRLSSLIRMTFTVKDVVNDSYRVTFDKEDSV